MPDSPEMRETKAMDRSKLLGRGIFLLSASVLQKGGKNTYNANESNA
jgi:hypothetical protein